MTYAAPVAEQRFLLRHIVKMEELTRHERFAQATAETVDAILEGIAAFAEGEFAPLNRIGDRVGAKWSEQGVTMPDGFKAAYRAYVEGGWGSLAAPVEFGGQGLPLILATVVLEDLGSANMAFSLVAMLSAGAVEALPAHGSPELNSKWMPKLISGEWPATMNLTEPQAGSDVGALKTSAERQPDGSYRIRGQKIFITYGEHDLAENIVHLVLARTPDAPPGTRGISLFVVPKYLVGEDGSIGEPNDVRCVSIEHKMGIHASPTCVMSYGDEGRCTGWLVGQENGGMRGMFTMMNNARLNVGLQGVSIAERATQAAAAYAMERVQGSREGRPARIVEHPDVRRMLLRMKALTQAARALTYYAAGQTDRGCLGDADAKARADLLTPLVKAYGTDVGVEVASLGVQVHGGMGFIEETGAAQHCRDARIAPIYEGTNGIQAADLVGRKLGLQGGETVKRLIEEIRSDGGRPLEPLLDEIEDVIAWMNESERTVDDRMAGSYPLLTMMAVAVSAWLMKGQEDVADQMQACGEGDPLFIGMKLAACSYYRQCVVSEAIGLKAAARHGKESIYAVPAEAFSA
ncbi:MAG TPA: acyl-CoA dehydrogenase [Allosphingosinicella sp.]|jgi:alkylation response protein AidB-like acyl-CoA dehydrogenase